MAENNSNKEISELISKDKSNVNNDINEKVNLGDNFWLEDINILFNQEKIYLFIPSNNMTLIEKLNAIFRLSIIISLGLYLFTSNYLYLYIFIIVGIFTYFIYYYQKDNVELYLNSINNSKYNDIQEALLEENKHKSEIEPTVNNPFMNINLITSDKTKDAAPSSWNNDEIQDEIEDKFNYNLYRDVGDLYGKSNSQRQYYTAPSTTIPNNQTGFAKWLYGQGPTCKEKSIYCAPEMPAYPYLDTNNALVETNVKY